MKVRKIDWDILTARPEGMDFEEYKARRKAEEKMIKERLSKGFMMWPSKGIFGVKDKEGKIIPVQSKGTFIGKITEIEFI